MVHLPFADVLSNPYVIALTGFCLGIIRRFYGMSGSFFLAPLLYSLGLPVTVAVGTSLAHQFGRSVLIAVKNKALRNASWKLGVILGLTGAGGIFLARNIILHLEGMGIAGRMLLSGYAFTLIPFCLILLWTHLLSRKYGNSQSLYGRIMDMAAKVSRVNLSPMVPLPGSAGRGISLWLVVGFGVATGLLSGLMGFSGSFIRLPALVFLAGLPLVPALCTDVLASLISLGIGSAGFAAAGGVEIIAVILLLLGSAAGFQIGHLATGHVSRSGAKLAFIACVAPVPAGLLLNQLGHSKPAALLTFGGPLSLAAFLLVTLLTASLRAWRRAAGYPAARKMAQGEK